jgi:hypothetical protein
VRCDDGGQQVTFTGDHVTITMKNITNADETYMAKYSIITSKNKHHYIAKGEKA